MDDVKLALLGDREAAKRLTDAGVLAPCPIEAVDLLAKRLEALKDGKGN